MNRMDVAMFLSNFSQAFGNKVDMPIAFYYSSEPLSSTKKINGCFFKGLEPLKSGNVVTLSREVIGCMGGKFYTGFSERPEHIPKFVSLKERYKQTPEMVTEFIDNIGLEEATHPYLNLIPVDKLDSFDDVEGIIFFATPDVLSGLATWVYFDNNADDAIVAKFGSGCSATISESVVENRRGGRRTFLGLFDPSVRPYVGEYTLSLTIPMSRFKEMYVTMPSCSLFDTHAWGKVRSRINGATV